MLIKNLSKRERFIAVSAVSFVALAALYNFIIDPVISRWQDLNDRINSKTAMLRKDLSLLAAKKGIEANYAKFSRYIKSDKNQEESAAEALTFLEDLSRSDSCTVLNIKPIGVKDYGSYKEILIDLSSDGGVGQFTKFLYDVETSKNMLLKIRRFSLSSKAGQESALKGTFLIAKIVSE